jgi:hypothetical protein
MPFSLVPATPRTQAARRKAAQNPAKIQIRSLGRAILPPQNGCCIGRHALDHIRRDFGLGAQMTVRAIAKVVGLQAGWHTVGGPDIVPPRRGKAGREASEGNAMSSVNTYRRDVLKAGLSTGALALTPWHAVTAETAAVSREKTMILPH